jgi:hypothetical protein
MKLFCNKQQEEVLIGLGNGTLLKFKRKKLKLDEMHQDIHKN